MPGRRLQQLSRTHSAGATPHCAAAHWSHLLTYFPGARRDNLFRTNFTLVLFIFNYLMTLRWGDMPATYICMKKHILCWQAALARLLGSAKRTEQEDKVEVEVEVEIVWRYPTKFSFACESLSQKSAVV